MAKFVDTQKKINKKIKLITSDLPNSNKIERRKIYQKKNQKETNPMRSSRGRNRAIMSDCRDALIPTESRPIFNLIFAP
jgi:hypothetical protein